MSNYPKWLLALVAVNVLPLLLCIFFLFGGMLALRAACAPWLRAVAYVGVQLLWLLPVASIFVGLDLHIRGWERAGVAVIVAGNVLTLFDAFLVVMMI